MEENGGVRREHNKSIQEWKDRVQSCTSGARVEYRSDIPEEGGVRCCGQRFIGRYAKNVVVVIIIWEVVPEKTSWRSLLLLLLWPRDGDGETFLVYYYCVDSSIIHYAIM